MTLLTRGTVNRIRKAYKTGKYTQQELAEKYGTSRSNVGYIVRWETRTDC